MRIAVLGTGYQGLVVGTCLAENGHQVTCVDSDEERIRLLSAGHPPIHEPGLEELIARNLEEERLEFSNDLEKAVGECLLIFLCVSTAKREDVQTDMAAIMRALKAIAPAMTGYRIIINKTACPPGTADDIEQTLRQATAQPFDVVVNPDFLKEGSAIDDFMRPDRVVVGCEDVRVREILKELYSPFLRTGKPCLFMSKRSAEMMKYATNVMLAARISLINQIADVCEVYGADIAEVREGVAADDRIGSTFLFPGLGFGGAGLPKDLTTCIALAEKKGVSHDLFDAVLRVNERRQSQFLARILGYYDSKIGEKHIAIWGASFKPRTDDLRGAPALKLVDALRAAGAQITVYDPVAGPGLLERYGDSIRVVNKYYAALEGADGLVIVTEWNEFRRPDYDRMGTLMREKVIFDGRNLYTPAVMRDHGFKYFSVGRPPIE
ncbi:MAG: UDP-glucose/GDP-mannose dehydrogenase family protein [Candidatus Hydrogenedentes bacterium]|nr:UDP-glucose/GDP-mannose dehydrogenase family protein [Candidatus Hydrogenedentota bacterium]